MKIRIKGPSIRLRLSRSEVAAIIASGYIEERTPFPDGSFVYALERVPEGDALSAQLRAGKITVMVPEPLIRNWDKNDLISIAHHLPLSGEDTLHLLLEKDFQCLDRTDEDQSDNYTNPNKNC